VTHDSTVHGVMQIAALLQR